MEKVEEDSITNEENENEVSLKLPIVRAPLFKIRAGQGMAPSKKLDKAGIAIFS